MFVSRPRPLRSRDWRAQRCGASRGHEPVRPRHVRVARARRWNRVRRGTEPACGCIASVPGSACIECNQAGYISGTSCVCDVPHALQDPTASSTTSRCRAPQWRRFRRLGTTPSFPQMRRARAGTARSPSSGATRRATRTCCSGRRTPRRAAGAATRVRPAARRGRRLPGLTLQKVSCRGYGATDPQLSWTNTTWATGWQTCAGHGAWNYTQVGCECDAGWTLVPNGFDGFFEQPQYVCSQCAPFAGPDAHSVEYEGLQPVVSSATSQSFCSLIYTPRVGLNANGAPAMCSGNGVDLGNGQGARASTRRWPGTGALTQVSDLVLQYQLDRTRRAHVIQTLTNATAWTCAACNTNYTSSTVDEGCL